jgi:hypothetical protein
VKGPFIFPFSYRKQPKSIAQLVFLSVVSFYKFWQIAIDRRIINWINGTSGLSAAFDFTTKGILQVCTFK